MRKKLTLSSLATRKSSHSWPSYYRVLSNRVGTAMVGKRRSVEYGGREGSPFQIALPQTAMEVELPRNGNAQLQLKWKRKTKKLPNNGDLDTCEAILRAHLFAARPR